MASWLSLAPLQAAVEREYPGTLAPELRLKLEREGLLGPGWEIRKKEMEAKMEGEELLKRAGYQEEVPPAELAEQYPVPKFKSGDVVRLKSGGPLMTVRRIEDLGGVVAIWMTHDGDFRDGRFSPSELDLQKLNPAEDMTSAP